MNMNVKDIHTSVISPTSDMAIMFADISGSTSLYDSLGDMSARVKIRQCLNTITNVVEEHQGVVVKTMGDEVMCTFPSAEFAIDAACEMNESLESEFPDMVDETPLLSIRIGLHYGPAINDADDLFGDTVNIAARMVQIAKAGQILTTFPTVDALSLTLKGRTRLIDRTPIKGKKEYLEIYEVIWKEDELTRLATRLSPSSQEENTTTSLFIRFQLQAWLVNQAHSVVLFGRSKSCNFSIEDELVSRQHAKIEYRKGKFFIVDQSTNGTYIRHNDQKESFLRREEMQIQGSGQMSLGRSFEDINRKVVSFTLVK